MIQYYEDLNGGFANICPLFPEVVMAVAAFAEFADTEFVPFGNLQPRRGGTCTAEGKDNGTAAVGKGDEPGASVKNLCLSLGERSVI